MGDSTTSTRDVKSIIIVGGSLAALLAGVILKTLPQITSITILERSEPDKLKDQGAGIRLAPEVVDTLRNFASFRLEDYAVPQSNFRMLGLDGQDTFNAQSNSWSTSWGRLFSGLRKVFEEASRDHLRTAYRTGCRVKDVINQDSNLRVEAEHSDGKEESWVADLVVGADGSSSTLRHLVEPDSTRTYVGYVALRGLVPTPELSERAQNTFDNAAAFFLPEGGSQVVIYTVPDADIESGTCVNWVWYQLKTEDQLADLMTDGQGVRHLFTLPMGSMRKEVVESVHKEAATGMPPQLTEAFQKTKQPFVQIVTDNLAGENSFFGGKMLLVGDAAAGQRPHSASALTQASFHALLLKSMLQGYLTSKKWSSLTHKFSSILIENGHALGSILMTDDLSVEERTKKYMQEFQGAQNRLNSLWNEVIGSDLKAEAGFAHTSRS